MYRTLSPGAIDVSVSFEEGARLAARYGFAGLALDAGHLLGEGAEAVRETLHTHGLKPGSFGLPVDLRGDDDAYEASLGRLASVAEAARQVGCTRASTYIFSWSDERDYAANFAFHQERLVPPAAILAEHGISLGLEFLGPKTLRDGHPYGFIHTVREMLELCDAVGPNVGLLLDAWHWYTSGHDPADLELLSNQNVVDVHVNDAPAGIPVDEQVDSVRCLPGETGVVDLNRFLSSLQRIGYDGPVSERRLHTVRELLATLASARTHPCWSPGRCGRPVRGVLRGTPVGSVELAHERDTDTRLQGNAVRVRFVRQGAREGQTSRHYDPAGVVAQRPKRFGSTPRPPNQRGSSRR